MLVVTKHGAHPDNTHETRSQFNSNDINCLINELEKLKISYNIQEINKDEELDFI